MTRREPIRFFTDQNVPESVARVLENAGYEVVRLREKVATNSPDNLVAAVSEANKSILVTMDRDFKAIAARAWVGKRRFRTLSVIRFEKCRESRAAERMQAALSLIEHEWKVGAGDSSRDRRVFIVICTDVIRIYR